MRALVVGAGRMGTFHSAVLRDLGFAVSTADPDPAAGADYLRAPGDRVYHVAVVAVPIPALAAEAYKLLGRCRKLLIEKPMAANAADAADLARICEGHDVAVGYVERFNPVVRRLAADDSWARSANVVFRRWNTRPSPNVRVDLATHDFDLYRFLDMTGPARFDARADSPMLQRTITISGGPKVDLTAHETSPLHAMWRAFLADQAGYATPQDAVQALERAKPPKLKAAA